MTVIKLPEWDGWRIEGTKLDWQIQELINDKKSEGGKRWKGVNFYPAASYAVGAAYERTLRECGKEFASLADFEGECARVKDELIAAVKKAIA